ncbi:DEAD/DEAH box helicase domain-containing protein [Methanobrevibacter ruminantium M1]|uniref:DEAD/DEAH box helicase domain-containing protein n=1 Tax=Methanobrevibacter ruminantium (strain ATCC 35063 / DSM 1093 / JCM 13430 / OCM 146 / M1) TaxID=634498 RepID=D3E350_METRM|nr:DEAD/DEAH box helicase [Methanobrevibacter ruminantium]ADC46961.1 DEAD/DEAH box helicase domain-containing protein [Methanobrevibacter ruminantium M1]
MSTESKDKQMGKIDQFKNDIRFRRKIEYVETIPGKDASYKKVDVLNKRILQYLEDKKIKLYRHQALAIEKTREDKNIIITTPTASGKTLAFNLPVLEELISDNDACALYIYPAKALSYDQLKVLRNFEDEMGLDLNPNPYDGDTPKAKRYKIRQESRIILTNPYQIHHILAWHHQWERFYSNLKYIIIDEAHYYKGIFGSNVAFLIRRLKRIAKFYGSEPKFILSSATLANPLELAEKLTGESFELIDEDSSPSGEKDFVLYNPYKSIKKDSKDQFDMDEYSRSVHMETERIFLYLILKDIQTLCFTSSRKIAELIALWTKRDMEKVKKRNVEKIAAYRAGYLAEDRRQIEDGLKSRDYLGVTSTNALELGINIGSLDAVIISGFPGSMISTWQQGGRSGRTNQKSLVILVAFENQLDQYFMKNPEFFFDKPHENVVIDLNNEKLLKNHIICAANELPLTLEEAKEEFNVTEDFLDNIVRNRDLRKSRGFYIYPYDDSPSFNFSLDQISNEIFTVMNGRTVIEHMEKSNMYREAHEGAVLINQGQTYIVNKVDLDSHFIFVKKKDVEAHTIALKRTNIKITKKIKKHRIGEFTVHFGELEVEEDYFKYKLMQYSKVIGEYIIDLPPLKFNTKGIWFTIPDSVKDKLEEIYKDETEVFAGGLHGTEHAMIGLFPLHVMCDRFDIGGLSTNYHEDTQEATIFIYDGYEGGIGICEKAIDLITELTKSTRNLIKNCECKDGCPSCIYSPKCGNDNKPLHKKATEYILDYMWDEMNKLSPEDLAKLEEERINTENSDYDNLNGHSDVEVEYDKKPNNAEIEIDDEREADNAEIEIEDDEAQEEYEKALEEFNKENYSIAKDILTDIIINYDNQSADAYYLIGKILFIQGDSMGALSFVKKALSIEPAHELANEFYFELKNSY